MALAHNHPGDRSITRALQRRLVSYSTAGIFSISIIIATTSFLPLYRDLRRDQEESLVYAAQNRSIIVQQFLQKIQDIALQITSRTRIRQALEEYNQGLIDLESLREFSTDKLLEALNHSEDIAAIARYDINGQQVVRVGYPAPVDFWLTPPAKSDHLLLGEPFDLNGNSYLMVQAPIVNPDNGDKVGTDVVLFHATRLQGILQNQTSLAQTSITLIAEHHNENVEIFPLLRDWEMIFSEPLQAATTEAIPIHDTSLVNLQDQAYVLAFTPIQNTNWWLLILSEKTELYAPLGQQLIYIVLMILLLSTAQTVGIILLLRPLADQVLIRAENLENMAQKLQAACEQSPVSIVIADPQGNVEYVNPKFEEITGYSASEIIGKNPRVLKSGYTSKEEYHNLWQIITSGETWHGQFRNRRKTGELFWESASISPIKNERGEIIHFVAVKEDITERKKDEETLLFQANYDALTGLPNRTLAFDRLHQVITRADQNKTQVALIFLDLDRFKNVNDSLGHEMGDQLLKHMSERLQKTLRNTDTVARLGGDEFLIIIGDLETSDQVEAIAQKILTTVDQPLLLKNEEVSVSASIGIAFYPKDGTIPEQLIQQSDTAMYVAKQEGRSTFRCFNQTMNEASQTRLRLESRLRHALEKQEISVVYQPSVNLRTNTVMGAEALMRWHNPELGNVPPDQFIVIAEETGMINQLGQWILSQACQEAAHWQTLQSPMWVAVNLSPRQVREKGFFNQVMAIVEQSQLPFHCLELEITEHLLIEQILEAKDLLNKFRDCNMNLAVDDFGTGYSSLSYLRQYPFTTVKIDGSFIQDLPHNQEAVSLVKTILAMAQALDLKTIAEGIETREQLEFLIQHGCDYGQGYLFSKPLPANEFRQFIIAFPNEIPRPMGDPGKI